MSDKVIREAYERAVFQKGSLDWPYMNGILRSWHMQGLHTLEEVRAAEQRRRQAPAEAGRTRTAAPVDSSDLDRLWAEMNENKEG
jgi:DNA replication protein DnaD